MLEMDSSSLPMSAGARKVNTDHIRRNYKHIPTNMGSLTTTIKPITNKNTSYLNLIFITKTVHFYRDSISQVTSINLLNILMKVTVTGTMFCMSKSSNTA
jgi:hypothetical protein